MVAHEWIRSTLGHGESMRRRCHITNREAAVLGMLNTCDAATDKKEPIARNCQNWSAGHCEACGVQWQFFEVGADFKCPHFRATP